MLKGCKTPMLIMSGSNSPFCKIDQTLPVVNLLNATTTTTDEGSWGLCPFIGKQASQITPKILKWLDSHRKKCW